MVNPDLRHIIYKVLHRGPESAVSWYPGNENANNCDRQFLGEISHDFEFPTQKLKNMKYTSQL